MQHHQSWFLGIIVVLLLFFILFMPILGVRMRGLLSPQVAVSNNVEQLTAENESLKARLAELAAVEKEMPTSTPNTVRAMVYSGYPFNFKNEMTLNAGIVDGVAIKDIVMFQKNLLGIIERSSIHSSVAQTIFDPNFKLHVRIGPSGYDALLVGGAYPMVESIAKDASVSAGDIVYSADSNVPYAMPLGEIANVSLAANNLFQEASLSFPYDMGMIQTVEIMKNVQ
jgi:cell shape-determining protein MreC